MSARAQASVKFALVQRFQAASHTIEEACMMAGLPVATFYKWRKKGLPGESAPTGSTGRPSALTLDKEEHAALRRHALSKDSGRLAVEDFIRDPQCRAETAEVLLATLHRAAAERKPISWPLCIRRVLSVTPEEKNQFRSRRATLRSQFVGRRGMFGLDEEGNEFPILPGDVYVSDDMSVNEPFRFTDPESGEQLLGRQTLNTMDSYSMMFLGGSPVGRKKDAYRTDDIADHMLAIVQAFGLPLFWTLERGPWENNFINGISLEELGRPGERWGALNQLFHIHRAWTPNQKGEIEGGFRHLQRIGAHPAESLSIGAYAGEFEQAGKYSLQAKKGKESSLLKFWTIQRFADVHASNMERFNTEQKLRECLGGRFSPDELYLEHPGKRELKREDAWLFNPVKKVCTIRNGSIETTVKNWPRPFVFQVNGVAESMFLATGHQVLIAFHPGHPENGCAVFNADMGPRNRQAWRFGQFLLTAPNVALAPRIDLSGNGPTQKKAADAAMRSEFRAVRGPGQITAPSISSARDGLGDSLHIARGQSPSADMPVPAGRLASHSRTAAAASRDDSFIDFPPSRSASPQLASVASRIPDAAESLADLESF